jgi:hypothetical protein
LGNFLIVVIAHRVSQSSNIAAIAQRRLKRDEWQKGFMLIVMTQVEPAFVFNIKRFSRRGE